MNLRELCISAHTTVAILHELVIRIEKLGNINDLRIISRSLLGP